MNHSKIYENCSLCPRNCHIDRTSSLGFCQSSSQIKAARAALHHWEEPCISGTRGSGAVFFSGCTLRCCFCQNYSISSETYGKEISEQKLAQIFLELQNQGAHNINLVTATQYLPDLKYFSSKLSQKYSKAEDYFKVASNAVRLMIEQTGKPVFDSDGILQKGVIIRHLVLPNCRKDSITLLHWIKETLPDKSYLISLLSQYTPFYKSHEYPELNRRITTYEYESVLKEAISLGLVEGFMQEKSSAKEEYTPPFNLEGL